MMKRTKMMKYGIMVLAMAGILLVAAPQTQAATIFSDGSENSTVGARPGVNDPTVGTWDHHWAAAVDNIKTRTGATAGGPSAAYAGDNYLQIERVTGSTNILAAFSPVDLATRSLHGEFQMYIPAYAWNLTSIGFTDGAGYAPFASSVALNATMVGDYVGDARTHSYAYDFVGATHVDVGANGVLIGDAWNKVEMDWNHVTGKFTLTINSGTPWEAPAAMVGPATTIDRLQWFPAPGLVFVDEVLITEVPEPATMMLLGFGSIAVLVRKRRRA